MKYALLFLLAIPVFSQVVRQNGNSASSISGTVAVGNGGTGTSTQFTSGSVVFSTTSGVYSQDNANFFYKPSSSGGPSLGIGNSNPGVSLVGLSGYVLDVGSTAGPDSALRINGTSGPRLDFYSNASGDGFSVAKVNTAGGGLRFMSSGGSAELVRFKNNGNVGIGSANPATLLHISSGTLTIDGTGTGLNITVPGFSDTPGTNAFNLIRHTNNSTQFDWRMDSSAGNLNLDGNNSGSPITLMNFSAQSPARVGIGAITGRSAASTLEVLGNVQFGATVISSFTVGGALNMGSGAAITLAGANGNVVSASSITTTSGLFGASASITGSGNALTVTSSATVSGAMFVGTQIAVSARGTAGTAQTVSCPAGTFAQGGGCDCTVEVAETSKLSVPSPTTSGAVPTGWTCQSSGGTGGQCISYAICSRLQ